MTRAILLLLFFVSGAAALIYEVLWLKELGRLFGVTAYAAATTLAVFFLGLSAGGFVWGRRVANAKQPLRTYALLELGIAVTALLYFLLLDLYRWIYAPLLGSIHVATLALAVKFLLAALVLFPPALFMGGTLPVLAQVLVRRADQLGRTASLLYALNTVGAAAGAFLAGFVLPVRLGFRASYFVAISLNLLIAAFAWILGRREAAPVALTGHREDPPLARARGGARRPAALWSVAAASGFITLGLEVLWTRMYAQVLQNSVYTFAVILTVFLVSLALGSVLANRLCHLPLPPVRVLTGLVILSGILVGLTPLLFLRQNPGLVPFGSELGWTAYIASVFANATAVLLIPVVVMGSVFPFLMKVAETGVSSAGRTIGQLAAVNTVGAILGSLAAGFVLLDVFGLWTSIRILAMAYLAIGLMLPATGGWRWSLRAIAGLGIVVFAAVETYPTAADVHLDREHGEELVAVHEGSQGTVAVVRRGDDLRLKVNNSYLLGTSRSALNLRLQAQLPLVLLPAPRKVFFLGMGTGISAGGALDFPVEEVVVCELNQDVVAASREHFAPFVNGLYDDPRVRILVEDGRIQLAVSRERYDAIIADIFLTYKAGTGNLYTREHFETVRSRLEPGGIFAQWLTLFDLTSDEFSMIAHTMLEVFPQVTLWRRGFSPTFPVFCLLAQESAAPLPDEGWMERLAALGERGTLPADLWFVNLPHAAYAGNVSAARTLFASAPLCTDDHTPIEYLAPITERNSKGARITQVLAWEPLADFCDLLLRTVPPDRDPYLTASTPAEIDHVRAGLAYYRYETYRRMGRLDRAQTHLQEYRRLVSDLQSGK